MLYEVAFINQPNQKQREEGIQETLIAGPTAVIAKDTQSASVAAAIRHKDSLACYDTGQVQVLVRPFA
jgi:hypothetical protein